MIKELQNGFRLYVKGGLESGNIFPTHDNSIEFTCFIGGIVLDIWKNGYVEVCEMPF